MFSRGLAARIRVLIVSGGLWLAGCGGGTTPPLDEAAFLTCATETRAMPYQAGMSVTSLSGFFTVKLLSSTPGPPIKGQNRWVVEIDDSTSGAPLEQVELTASPFMPDHKHPTQRSAVVTPAGSGTYILNPVYLFMSGYWEVSLNISAPTVASGAPDLAVIPVCIP
jgi:hypothetical protein